MRYQSDTGPFRGERSWRGGISTKERYILCIVWNNAIVPKVFIFKLSISNNREGDLQINGIIGTQSEFSPNGCKEVENNIVHVAGS